MLVKLKQHKTYKTNFEAVVKEIKHIANKFYYKFKSHKVFSYLINKSDIAILKKLKSDKNIIICKPDKGNGVVILDKNTYVDKMNMILNNDLNFTKGNHDLFKLSLKLEDSLNLILRKLLKHGKIEQSFYHNTYASGSSP